jgi:hypothetical protein
VLLGIAVVLLVLWGLGFFLSILGDIIHIALVLAVIVAVVHFVRGASGRSLT